MARWEPWQVIDGAYKDDARPWSCQDTVNWLPAPAEQPGTRSAVMLRTPPGLVEFCDLGTNAPLRGAHDVEGLLLAVSGTTLFRISAGGTATAIGTIPGVERVSMDHTPRGAGFHVGIANGQSGYIYDTAAGTLTQITDEGFPGAIIFQFIDGYLAFLEPFGKFWGHSELNDGLNYNTLDRYTAESAPDNLRALIVSHREVFVPGSRTGEFFRNNAGTGAGSTTFSRADGYEMEVGAASAYAVCRLDNTVYWLGDDGIVYRLEGHQPVRISNGPIEQALARSNLDNAFAFAWSDKGHNVFYLTLPDGQTWGYDAWTQRWHRRQSYGLNRWRLATLTKWNRQWIGGDYSNGKLYTLDWSAVHEDSEPLVSERTFPVAHDFGNDLLINGIRLFFDTGKPSAAVTDIITVTGDLPGGHVGSSGTLQYMASGRFGPYTFDIASGSLPPGATMDANGLVTYTYTVEGAYSWTVRASDQFGNTGTLPDTAVVASTVLTNWVKKPHPMAQTALDVAVHDGIIAIVGNNRTGIYSTDQGDSWTSLSLPSMNPSGAVWCITKFDEQWFALGFNDAMVAPGDTFVFSALANPPSVIQRGNTVHNGALYVSSNSAGVGVTTKLQKLVAVGAAWTLVDTGIANGGNVMDMATGGGVTIIGTDVGVLIRTTDMATFTQVGTVDPPGQVSGVAYLNGRFIASSNSGIWKYSDDGGLTWTLGTTVAHRFIIGTSQIFAGGNDLDIFTSATGDAGSWVNRLSVPGPITLNGGAAADQTLAAVTDIALAVRVGTA
jgi:hypothetical protein